jgi:hypothetical protein
MLSAGTLNAAIGLRRFLSRIFLAQAVIAIDASAGHAASCAPVFALMAPHVAFGFLSAIGFGCRDVVAVALILKILDQLCRSFRSGTLATAV